MSYRDYQRQRQLTLGDLLLENRIILLQGEIHDGNANELVMKLLYLQSENRRKDIHFYINSPGGSVTRHPGHLRHHADPHLPGGDLLRGAGGQRRGRPAGRRQQGQTLRPAARQDHAPPALRAGRRPGLRHRNPGRGNPQDPRRAQPDPGRPHRPVDRAHRQGHRPRLLHERRRGQAVRRGRRHPHQAARRRRRENENSTDYPRGIPCR